MTIAMELVDGRWCPVARCAHCGERITDPDMAGVVWGDESCQATSPAPVLILCKTNQCLSRGPGRHRLWLPLRLWLLYATDNAGMTPAQWWRARFTDELRSGLR